MEHFPEAEFFLSVQAAGKAEVARDQYPPPFFLMQ
jgi:hypothetical protein